MSSSRFAAIHIVPLLGRILLFGAFVPAGYGKIFTFTDLTPAQSARLDAIGWSWTPPPAEGAPTSSTAAPSAATKPAPASPGAVAKPTSAPPSAPAKPAASPTTPIAPAKAPPATSASLLRTPPLMLDDLPIVGALAAPAPTPPPSAASAAPPSGATASQAPATGTIATSSETAKARMVETLALLIDSAGMPAPRATAWLVAIIELVGGVLILPGIFSRLCAFGMACIMGGAIWLTSLAALKAHPFIIGMTPQESSTFFIQAALLFISFGILLTGPGGASVDQALFGRSSTYGGAAKPARTGASSAGGGTS